MTYLVDANVLSEPTKQAADSKVVAWLNASVIGLSNGTKRWLKRSIAFHGTQ
jgi:predicted nucleic acid-binding protein